MDELNQRRWTWVDYTGTAIVVMNVLLAMLNVVAGDYVGALTNGSIAGALWLFKDLGE
jgi:hypothetical protein